MNVLILLFGLQVKHFMADFPLQTEWMILGKGQARNWEAPLIVHATIHGWLTFLVVTLFTGDWMLGGLCGTLDMGAHALIDRIKASPSLLGRFKDISQKGFWNAPGADQMAHQFCYLLIAALVLWVGGK